MTSQSAAAEARLRRSIDTFVPIDLIGASAGAAFVLVANLAFVHSVTLWWVFVGLLVLVAALRGAGGALDRGMVLRALVLITGGNWLIAVVVAYVIPILWPVMILAVIMPLVLATPYLSGRTVLPWLLAAAVMAGVVAAVGLLNEGGGAVLGLSDTIEFALVVGALMAMITPIALIVWQNNRLQQANLDTATELNAELLGTQRRLADSRRRVVEAADAERLRIERDLHDGAQQRLVTLGVRLRLLEAEIDEASSARPVVTSLIGDLEDAVDELRVLAHGIYPPLLQSRGLGAALGAVVRRSPLDIETTIEEVGRLPRSVEIALYFAALEALTNAAKHAPDATVRLALSRNGPGHEGRVTLEVNDDGPGFEPDPEHRSRGTDHMADRLAAVNGTLVITSVIGRGTTITATVPVVGDVTPTPG